MEIQLFEFDDVKMIYKGWLKNDFDHKNFNVIAEFNLDGECINRITKIKLTIKDVSLFWNKVANQD